MQVAMTDTRLTEAQAQEIERQYEQLREDSRVDTEADAILEFVEGQLQFHRVLTDRRVLEEALTREKAVGRIWKRRLFQVTGQRVFSGFPDPAPEEIDAEVKRGG